VIIKLESTSTTNLDEARQSLQSLTRTWEEEITSPPGDTPTTGRADSKGVDPVALASAVVSLPSAALAVADLADRIRKRRRAAELIDHARQQAARQVTITLIAPGSITNLATLTPDQLLDLQATQDPAS
jgi:hypothetical protein